MQKFSISATFSNSLSVCYFDFLLKQSYCIKIILKNFFLYNCYAIYYAFLNELARPC